MKLYVDMDGVLTDFDRQLSDLLGYPIEGDETSGKNSAEVWKKIEGAGVEYWSEMPWMPQGRALWDHVKRYDPTILTAPARHEECKTGKRKWLKDNIPGVSCIIESKKEKYADPNSILIDDREKNIDAWNKAGGIGILHKDNDETVSKLEEIMSKKMAAMKEVINPETGKPIYVPKERLTPESGGRRTNVKPPKKGKGTPYNRQEEKQVMYAAEREAMKYKTKPAETKADLDSVMTVLHRIVGSLDRIADRLEGKGMIREAQDIDLVSNTLEMIEAAGVSPMDYANKFDHIQEDNTGTITGDRGGRRFKTNVAPPPQVKNLFKQAPDGMWYLVGDNRTSEVIERPGGKFFISQRALIPVPGLQVAE